LWGDGERCADALGSPANIARCPIVRVELVPILLK
jgi:hypothetical protein